MYHVWGFSERDVYIGGDTPSYPGKLWHFNGTKWEPVKLHADEGGPLTHVGDISDLHGTPDGTLYATGYTGSLDAFMIRFNGSSWRDVSPASTRPLQSVFISDASNVWVGGINGTLLHFDARFLRFTPYALPLDIPPDADPFYRCSSIAGDGSNPPVLLLAAPMQYERYYLFEFVGGTWNLFDSVYYEYRRRVWYSPEGTLYCVGDGVHRRSGNSWETFLPEFRAYSITGTSDKNLFVVGRRGVDARIYHFNGLSWYLYKEVELPNAVYYDCWTDGTSIFAVGVLDGYPTKSVVVQGR
jgi:hypothetical protein